jgi:hypothetical protein
MLGGWQVSGITTAQTGEPVTITNGGFYDNAGVGNSVGSGSYADLVGDPHGPKPTSTLCRMLSTGPCLTIPELTRNPQVSLLATRAVILWLDRAVSISIWDCSSTSK